MALRTTPGFWTTTFLASLGIGPVAGCSSSPSDEGTAQSGTEGEGGGGASGGDTASGGSDLTGGGTGVGGSTAGAGQGGSAGVGQAGSGMVTGGTTSGGASNGGTASGGTGGTASGGAGAIGGTTSTGGGTSSYRCAGATAITGPGGALTGYELCPDGVKHRTAVVACGSALPRGDFSCPYAADAGFGGDCQTDADCTAQANGHCETGIQVPSCYCAYGCTTDADCGDGQICECGPNIGQCVPSDCTSDADCGPGRACAAYEINPSCGGTGYACHRALDECKTDADCGGSPCTIETGGDHRVCTTTICAIGRPYLVEGKARVAAVAARSDWAVDEGRADELGLSPELREALARHYTEVGQMEHASIAAFARFSLDLLSLGAPPELLEQTHRAMADETRHAREAFGLASRYAGHGIGPEALAVDGALGATPEEVVRTAVLEGCIGETVAAVEAAEAASRASDPRVASLLARVAEDETRHAELAWQFVKWALVGGSPILRSAAVTALTDLARHRSEPRVERASLPGPDDASLEAHGVLSESVRAEVRRRVMSDVVRSCAVAMLAGERRPAGQAMRGALATSA